MLHPHALTPSHALFLSMNLHDIFIDAFCIVFDIVLASLFAYIHISYRIFSDKKEGSEYSGLNQAKYFFFCMFVFMWLRLISLFLAFSPLFSFVFSLTAPLIIFGLIYILYRTISDLCSWYNLRHPSNEPL